MKIKIEVDCTPLEARRFLGLPDVEPMQEALMKQMQGQMANTLSMMDPEAVLKSWLPLGAQGLEHIQRMMWNAAKSAIDAGTRATQQRGSSGDKDKDREKSS
jgi:hypothetical protein